MAGAARIIHLAGGNFGVAEVLINLSNLDRLDLIDKIENLSLQKGGRLWVLYKDQCGQDLAKLVVLLEEMETADC
tara:strand:+ start:236 stop:460 length:225 start_codon:yes stop_codon:yes gene_type:complete